MRRWLGGTFGCKTRADITCSCDVDMLEGNIQTTLSFTLKSEFKEDECECTLYGFSNAQVTAYSAKTRDTGQDSPVSDS